MKIESCEKYKGSTYCVILENGKRFYLDFQVVFDYKLKSDGDYDVDYLIEAINENDLRKASKRAMHLLAVRDYGYKELVMKLCENYEEIIAYEVADKMVSYGYVNDEIYAAKLANYYINTKKKGKKIAQYSMKQRGLDSELIDEVLKRYDTDDIRVQILSVINKKYSDCYVDYKSSKRAFDGLMRNGYNFNDIKWCIDKYKSEVTENE